METVNTPPRHKLGGELSVGRRYAMVEIARAIPPGKTRLPKGTVGPLAKRYGVGLEYPTMLWKNCKAQIEDTQELDLSNKPRSGRPSMLTPTKAAALRAINSENRAFTNGQVSDRLKELGLEFSGETVRQWFEKEGARKVVRRIKPSLSESQKKRRIDFICDQVDEVTGNFLDQFNVIHLDESWFFLLKDKKIRMFPGEDIPGSPRVPTAQESRSEDHDNCGERSAGPDPQLRRQDWHLAHLRHENGPAQLEEEEGGGRVRV